MNHFHYRDEQEFPYLGPLVSRCKHKPVCSRDASTALYYPDGTVEGTYCSTHVQLHLTALISETVTNRILVTIKDKISGK